MDSRNLKKAKKAKDKIKARNALFYLLKKNQSVSYKTKNV
jgi:hypothetical protein